MKVYYTDRKLDPNDNEGIVEDELELRSFNEYCKNENDGALRFTTVNNYTFMTNPSRGVTMSRVDNKRPYEAFVEITQLAYNREYLVDVDLVNTDTSSSYRTATAVDISRVEGFTGDNRTDQAVLQTSER